MADTKRSGLTALAGTALADGDLIALTDISDTTMAASGTDKKTTLADVETYLDAGTHAKYVLDTTVATPVAAADTVVIFGRKIANRALPAFVGPSGLDSSLQPNLARNKVGYWNPNGGTSAIPGVFGYLAPTATGFTVTLRAAATTSMFTRMRRLGFVTVATAGTVGIYRVSVPMFTLGAGGTPALGGFFKVLRFGISDAAAVSGARMFWGMSSNVGAPTNVEPSTLTNCIGIGHGAADTNMKIFYGGSAAQTPIDLGVNFPANTRNVDVYDLALFAPPSAPDTVHYQVTRLNTDQSVSGTLAAATPGLQLPLSTTLLNNPWGYRTNNATALAVGVDFMSDYIETDQ
ncbi:MAG: hypothetical protein H0U13_11555 [Gemmatimonadaceae bacterium]|nr:hypothetical protein [Gemmatimonadaceae bacterium]